MVWVRRSYPTQLPAGGWDRVQIIYPVAFTVMLKQVGLVQQRNPDLFATLFELLHTYATTHIANKLTTQSSGSTGNEILLFVIGY